MTEHVIVRYAASSGYVASCACGWRSTRKTRELREDDAHRHQLEDSLVLRQSKPDAVRQSKPGKPDAVFQAEPP